MSPDKHYPTINDTETRKRKPIFSNSAYPDLNIPQPIETNIQNNNILGLQNIPVNNENSYP
jgi:hypothetical protein